MIDLKDRLHNNEQVIEVNKKNLVELDKKINKSRQTQINLSLELQTYERDIINADSEDKYKIALMYKRLLALQVQCAEEAEELNSLTMSFLRATIRILELEHENKKLKELI